MNGSAWSPSPSVRARGDELQRAIPNVQGSQLESDDSARIQLPVAPGTRLLAAWVKARWGLSSVGMARGASIRRPARRADGALRRRDVHEEGRAIDAMTADVAKGTEIAEALVFYAAELGIQYLIWRRTEWSSSAYATAWEPYTGTSDHADHVHAEVTPAMAASESGMRAALARVDALMAGRPAPPPVAPSPAAGRTPATPPAGAGVSIPYPRAADGSLLFGAGILGGLWWWFRGRK